MSVTTRTGLSEITFPKTSSANLLFKVADSANPVSGSAVQIVGHNEVTGQVTSGQFCQTGTSYTLYFAASFNRPFASDGTWTKSVSSGSGHCSGTDCGGYVSFDTSTDRTVLMKVGISFVSVADAEANVVAEDPGWSLQQVEARATDQWNEYQAKKIRQESLAVVVDQMALQPTVDAKASAAKLAEYKAHIAKWDRDLEAGQDQAKEFEAEVRHAEHQAVRFDLGEALLQISVVLSSITLFTRRRSFFFCGLTLGAVGVIIAASAWLVPR